MRFFRNTKHHSKWWKEREIDWQKDYLDTWNHPHRFYISEILSTIQWKSLLEVGCASGPNILNIIKHFPNTQVGGVDIVPEAIEVAQETFKGAFLKVCSAEDIMMSDNSTDVVLSDMTMMYLSNPDKAIKEIKRVTRRFVVFSELHCESFWGRMKLRYISGYYAHDYRKLLTKHGFKDIIIHKMPANAFDGEPQNTHGYFIRARKPKR